MRQVVEWDGGWHPLPTTPVTCRYSPHDLPRTLDGVLDDTEGLTRREAEALRAAECGESEGDDEAEGLGDDEEDDDPLSPPRDGCLH